MTTIQGKISVYANKSIYTCVAKTIEVEDLYQQNTSFSYINTTYSSLVIEVECDIQTGLQLQNSPNVSKEFRDIREYKYRNHIRIYTDGFKQEERSSIGAAVYCPDLSYTQMISINHYASVFTVEYIAISKFIDLLTIIIT